MRGWKHDSLGLTPFNFWLSDTFFRPITAFSTSIDHIFFADLNEHTKFRLRCIFREKNLWLSFCKKTCRIFAL